MAAKIICPTCSEQYAPTPNRPPKCPACGSRPVTAGNRPKRLPADDDDDSDPAPSRPFPVVPVLVAGGAVALIVAVAGVVLMLKMNDSAKAEQMRELEAAEARAAAARRQAKEAPPAPEGKALPAPAPEADAPGPDKPAEPEPTLVGGSIKAGKAVIRLRHIIQEREHIGFAIEVSAAGPRDVFEFTGWDFGNRAALYDDAGNRFTPVSAGLYRQTSIETAAELGMKGQYGVGSVTAERPRWDMLMFDKPPAATKRITLALMATQFGEQRVIKFQSVWPPLTGRAR